ncbi:MAG: hypothetical protein FVQ83_11520 [Chloroflexi bacterium]|nr:hypothetical protein [Chloroflexota bacterium]
MAEIIAILGGLLYFVQLIFHAFTQSSVLDEGLYQYKGYLFATGKYVPYQEYGPWTNHMPLSFLSYGYIQRFLEPGIRTGRYFAIFLAVLGIIAIWILVRRLGGNWAGAAAVWIMAMNPAMIKMYSLGVSQVLVFGMLAWILVLTIGENLPRWQIILGVFLSSLLAMTRLNLVPVLPLLLVYIFWQHGRRLGIWAVITGLLVVSVGHFVIWPGVFKLWANWLPQIIIPFLEARLTSNAATTKDIISTMGGFGDFNAYSIELLGPLTALFQGMRFHFVALTGTLSALMLLPLKRKWENETVFRATVFLLGLFAVLFGVHMWAISQNDSLLFAFPLYLSFFSLLGVVLVTITFPYWQGRDWFGWQILIPFIILAISAGISFGAAEEIGEQLLKINIPRTNNFFRTWNFLPGYIPLDEFLENNYGLDYGSSKKIVSAGVGFGIGILMLMVTYGTRKLLVKNKKPVTYSFGHMALIVFLGFGWLLSPTEVLGGSYDQYDCGGNVIASYETAGAQLADLIPSGSSVYWAGGDSPIILLSLPNIEIFPAQLNGRFSFRNGGDPDALERVGYWNQELANEWAQEADFILVEDSNYTGWLKDWVNSGSYYELEKIPQILSCRDNSGLRIFGKFP